MRNVRFNRGQSLQAIKSLVCKTLVDCGVEADEATAEYNIFIEFLTGLRPSQLLSGAAIELDEKQLEQLDSFISKREKRIPIQYILEETYFMGLKLKVRPGVFIPRPDTETLVAVSIEKLNEIFPTGKISMLEIGSGSGAIPVALLKNLSRLDAVSLDVNRLALEVTSENAVLHEVDSRLVVEEESEWWKIGRMYDALISNPPYIPRHQQPGLQPEVGLHEPEAALFGTDEDGLGFYRQICLHAREVVKPGGLIAVEVGDEQGESVRELFVDAGLREVSTHNDLNGIARVVSGRLPV
jgi:release factor glutamine methyltransferase